MTNDILLIIDDDLNSLHQKANLLFEYAEEKNMQIKTLTYNNKINNGNENDFILKNEKTLREAKIIFLNADIANLSPTEFAKHFYDTQEFENNLICISITPTDELEDDLYEYEVPLISSPIRRDELDEKIEFVKNYF